MRGTLVGLMALFGSSGALAQEMVGDPAKGEELFAGQCGGCHIIQNEAGEVLSQGSQTDASRNLYGIAGRVPGSFPDLFYSKLMRSYGESGAVWEEANFVDYVLDPTGFLHQATGMGGPSAMEVWIRDEQQAHDVWAYLSSFSPAED